MAARTVACAGRVILVSALVLAAGITGLAGCSSAGGSMTSSTPDVVPGGPAGVGRLDAGLTGSAASGSTSVVASPGSVSATATVLSTSDLISFSTPSKNIGCYISTTPDSSQARCDIRLRNWKEPAKPADCPYDFGQGISVDTTDPAAFVCAGDTALGGEPVLPYGQAVVGGPFRCVASQGGMSCLNTKTKHGFMLAKEGYQLI